MGPYSCMHGDQASCMLNISLLVNTLLCGGRCVILLWPLVLGLLVPMILWPSFPFVPLLIEESFPFIVSPLHVVGSAIHHLIRAMPTCRHCDLHLIVQPGLKPFILKVSFAT